MSAGGEASSAVFEPVLSKLREHAAEYFGSSAVRLVPAGAQERPFSHLLRVAIQEPGGATRSHVFVKVYKPKIVDGLEDGLQRRVLKDFDITRRVYESMISCEDLGAVRPVACYPDELAIVTEQAEGSTLLDVLHARATWVRSREQRRLLSETIGTVGRWIRTFQSTSPTGRRVTIDELRSYLDERLRRMVMHASGFDEAYRDRILRHVDRLAAQVAPGDLDAVLVHSDMSLGNILVSGRRVIVLDFAMSRTGTRLHDLSRLLLQFDLLAVKPHFGVRTIRELQRALLHGFDPSLTSDAPLFRLHLLIHRVNHLLTLTVRRAPMAEAVYNRLVRRQHSRWIAGELATARA